MDPVLLTVVAIIVLVLILRIFFGLAKFAFKLGLVAVIAILVWRFVVVRG